METQKQQLGRAGEDAAEKYLKNNGYKILERNWRPKIFGKTGKGEIDIIAKKGGALTFFEVKTLAMPASAESHGEAMPDVAKFLPEDRVNFSKKEKILQTAKLYLMVNEIYSESPWQIDILGVWYDELNKKWNIRHFDNEVTE